MTIQDTRRARLALLIDEQYGGSQSKFVERTGENQSEISGLLRSKSFGERKARKLEERAGLARGWLDQPVTIEEEGPAVGDQAGPQSTVLPRKLGLIASSEAEWMALVYVTQRELDLLTRYRSTSDLGKSLIETAAETASNDVSASGAAHQS